jgi:hypothetical protein
MNRELVERIAHAVLYEGYILYPYRPCVKNRQRWTFGGVYPPAYVAAQRSAGSDASAMQTECILRPAPGTTVNVSVRFLHLINRINSDLRTTWQEAVERDVSLEPLELQHVLGRLTRHRFTFQQQQFHVDGAIVREQQPIQGSVEVRATSTNVAGAYRLTVCIQNETPFDATPDTTRDDALMRSLVSTHAILLASNGGAFVSMTDPPDDCRTLVEACNNVGAWPILVGEQGDTDTILASPIILYDYPRLAPESPGDLFDSTEIDEILTLRIMTLSDAERAEMLALDDRARSLLERTESLTPEQLMSLHGTLRELRPTGGAVCGSDYAGGGT